MKNEIGQTLIDPNSIFEAIGSSNTRNCFGIGNIQRNLCGKFSLEGVFSGFGIETSGKLKFTYTYLILLNLA